MPGGEPVPLEYRDLIGFINEPLPEYSLAVLPAIEVGAGERKIDVVLRQLKDGVENIQDSSQFRLFLTTMAKFHDYSIGNLILIAIQKPGATHVAGFVTWKDLGRWVKGGEKGIAILAPVMPPKPKKEKLEAEEEEIELAPVYFKVVHVFDISQTEGKPLPEFEVPILSGEANEVLFTKVMVLAKSQGLDVSFEPRPQQDPAIKGQYFGKSIWVRPEEPRAQQLKSLIHELAHYYSEGVFRIARRDAETIAESAAFTVGAHYGFDSGVRSFPYVALWAQDKKVLEQNLGSVRKVATVILESLEKAPGGEKLLPALKPFDPYKFAEYVLRANAFSLYEIPIYSGLTGTNPLRVPDHIWKEALESIDGEFVKQGDLYIVKTPGVERPPDMRAAPTWREVGTLMSTEPGDHAIAIESDLRQSMSDEAKASKDYRLRGGLAETQSDKKTASLYEHIAGEEDTHYKEFSDRMKELEGVDLELLAATEGDPIRKFCCRQCRECAPVELLEEGKFPERIAWLRSHYKEKHPGMWGRMQPAVTPTEPLGTCYEDAWRFLIREEEEGELIHGSVQTIGKRINHAWVELPSLVWEPKSGESMRKDYFYEIAEPQEQARYTTEEAVIMAARTGNLGPWTDQERKQYLKGEAPAVIPTEPVLTPEVMQFARNMDMVNPEYSFDGNRWHSYLNTKVKTTDLIKQLKKHTATVFIRKKTLGKVIFYSVENVNGKIVVTDRSYTEEISYLKEKAAVSPQEELEFVADSPEYLAYTIEDIGYREKLDTAFETAIARAKGG